MRQRDLAALRADEPLQIGPYLVLGRLGAGAMGRVYLARSPSSRLVAVKTIRVDLAASDNYRERFAHEVAAARRVSGAFTASVIDADPDAQLPWLATVYVPAPSLAALIETCGPLPVPAIRWLAAGCAEALESIHQAGLVHRDLKPGNVLVGADGPKVIDFGLAHTEALPHLTGSGDVLGTPAFMAPEQAMGEREIDGAADVFALGATLLLAATGHPPFPAKSSPEAVYKLMTSKPDLSGLPEPLVAMVTACLERDPSDRPTPADLVAGLAPYLTGTGTTPPLPVEARAVIEDYRQMPMLQDPERSWGSAWDKELDRFLGRPAEAADLHSARTRIPKVTHRGARRTGHGHQRVGHYAIALAILLAGGGITAGVLLAGGNGAAGPPAPGPSASGLAAGQGPGPGPGPEGGGPPPNGAPPPGAITPLLTVRHVAQGSSGVAYGLAGSDWPPQQIVTVSISGGAVADDTVETGTDGTFLFPLNRNHEFFTGNIPPGTYTVQADSGPFSAKITFTVPKGQ
ncbi:MAG TPA: protein kinase [Actinocrinis sp.]|nr:protein kinase [Actinocrinis sp.]